MRYTSVLISLVVLVVGSHATNYCDPDLCDSGKTHIGCNNNNTFYSTCDTPALVAFTATLQSLVLNTHNDYRNRVASGATQFASASRMPILKWNAELAKLSEYNVRQCAIKHDECRNTDSFSHAGQNLGYIGTTATLTATIIQNYIKNVQDNWYAENSKTTQAWLDSYPSSTGGVTIGHFTAMVQDQATDIGCAAATYKMSSGTTKFNTVLLACDYSYNNMLGDPVYKKGTVSCTTRHSKYTSLCT